MTIRSIVAALFVCGSLSVVAQKPACCAGKGGDAKNSVAEHTAFLAEQLKLDADQTKAVKALLEKEGTAETGKGHTGDASASGARKDAGAVAEKEMKAILKPEQWDKYQTLKRQHGKEAAGCKSEAAAGAKGGACCASKKTAEAAKPAAVAPAH